MKERKKVLGETENGDTGVALSLRYCGLTELPESLVQLSELQCLDVTGNHLTELPQWLGNVTCMKKLVVDGNQLNTLQEMRGNLGRFEVLHCNRIRMTAPPTSIINATDLLNNGL